MELKSLEKDGLGTAGSIGDIRMEVSSERGIASGMAPGDEGL